MQYEPRKGTLPNLIIIGAQKCATTSLHYYLGLHPDIRMSHEKELLFFIDERNWQKGIDWYTSHFTDKVKICGETSPSYTSYPMFTGVPQRMCSLIPQAKLLYIIRDPIERIISHYVHSYAERIQHKTLSEVLQSLENNPYVFRSQYYMQLEQYLQYFPSSNVLIITTEELQKTPYHVLQRIFDFLQVDSSFSSKRFRLHWHQSKFKRRRTRLGMHLENSFVMRWLTLFPFEVQGALEKLLFFPFSRKVPRPVLEPRFRQQLLEFFRDDVSRLRKYTGYSFDDWSV